MFAVNPFPVTGARIHRPLLRADTLSRERLNGWLEEAVTGRLALIVAEAGFGKTTLLADWSRHTERLTAWYRLESDDRDWLTFLRHLVASGRELDPEFAAETYARLLQLGPGGPTQADLVSSLVRDMSDFAAGHAQGFTLIFDDYHVIDRCDETEPIVRAILDRTGPGFSVIIASRAAPRLPLGRLRARGGVARLDGDDLCFDVPEADRLFRDAYHQPLEPDVVTSLIDRTEGWPALLSLVRTNIESEDANAVRHFVADLSGAAGDMYDFLAEEVVDRLPKEVAEFLTRVSILDEVDEETASAVAGDAGGEVVAWLSDAEAFSLVSRADAESGWRVSPLVRDLLAARLRSSIGRDAVRELHLLIARRFESTRWRIAATHYERAGESHLAGSVIERSLDQILGSGQYRAAVDLLSAVPGDRVVQRVLHSRLLLQIGAAREAMESAEAAIEAAEVGVRTHLVLALQNAASIAIGGRQYDDAMALARRAVEVAAEGPARDLSETYIDLIRASGNLSLPAFALRLEQLLGSQLREHLWHYAAITSLNLAQILVWLGRPDDTVRLAGEAERLFRRSSQGYEAVSVRLVQAHALAIGGRWPEAERLLWSALDTAHPDGHAEAVLEAALVASWYGPHGLARQILARVSREDLPVSWAAHWRMLDVWIAETPDQGSSILATLPQDPPSTVEVGAAFRWHLTVARTHLSCGARAEFLRALALCEETAAAQRSQLQVGLLSVLRSLGQGPGEVSQLLTTWSSDDDPILSVFSAELATMLGDLSAPAAVTVARAVKALPHRWLIPIRRELTDARSAGSARAASLLEEFGEAEDIQRLREFGRSSGRGGRAWGADLINRLAPRVFIEDLGLIGIRVGDRSIDGRGVRRKVLALLAFLAGQPSGSATPDQVLEALWPDLDPEQGSNSLHQTIYFLRRVIDPSYRAGTTAEYIHFDTEVVWLDPVLVDARSWHCRRLLSQRPETERLVEALVANYHGKFAADFAYEDWAASYREGLHAGYLAVVERAVSGAIGSSGLRWRLWVGQHALAIDPEADLVEAHVIRLYRELGAPAAAAEQYAHYSSMLRDQLGVDPPPIGDV
jgi:DNA-binding SARP family transcriptional activator/tetratricopeptide (TPR) repeat protein